MTRKTWVLVAAIVLVAATTGSSVAISAAGRATATASDSLPNTAAVKRGALSDTISEYGTLTYRARPDGLPYSVINRASGTYTALPTGGDTVSCGDVLYRVDDRPVLLLCGGTPAYRSLASGDSGSDVAELNANLVRLGYATRAQLDPSSPTFTPETASTLQKLQWKLHEDQTGSLDLGQVVFLPESLRVAAVNGVIGGSAQPGVPVVSATSDTPEVQVNLDPSEQDAVKGGDRARITLPNQTSVTGRVTGLGAVARAPGGLDSAGSGGNAGAATIPLYLSIDQPDKARGLDQASVRVEILTVGVENVLSVPVTAIVATSDGGYAVEVAHADSRRDLVTVTLGLFDDSKGRVQVEGDVHEGDPVVVPSS
ncbi:MAG: hypothetical protein JWM40_1932 [Frankiales bacterium]|nr:hypothetical protein [Frankiales bacterium]